MNHEAVEKNVGLLGVLIALVISVGGLVEIVPLYFQAVGDAAGAGHQAVRRRCSSRAATSTSARAATSATRR